MLQTTPDINSSPPYDELRRLYSKLFSLGYLNTDINTKFALISLINYVTYQMRQKNPDVTHYKVIKKIIGEELPEDFIKGLAVICEDFSYGCTTFPLFGLKPKEIINTIRDILHKYLPF